MATAATFMTVRGVKMTALMDAKGRDAIQQCVASNQGSVWLKSIIPLLTLSSTSGASLIHTVVLWLVTC